SSPVTQSCIGRIGPKWNGITLHPASRSRTPSSKASCIDGPAGASGFLQVQVIIRVRSCIRPLTATDTMVAGPDGVRGSRPHQRVALEWLLKLSGFARSSAPLDDHLLLLHLTPTGLGCGL